MAHQAERLPWQVLASVFDLKPTNPCQHDAPNLHPRDEPETGQKLCQFLEAFVDAVTLDVRQERQKYPEKNDLLDVGAFLRSMNGEEQEDGDTRIQYDRPSKDQIILTDELIKKIIPTVRRWCPHIEDGYMSAKLKQCPHADFPYPCECALPFKKRQLAAFQEKYHPNDCTEFRTSNGEAYHNLQFVKTLILLGEMDPVLQLCSSDECQLATWWEASKCFCQRRDLGWSTICEYAIKMYMVLNIIYCFPETRQTDNGSSIDDYRNLASYQMAIRLCTLSDGCQIATYPHRDVFGIEDYQFNRYPKPFDTDRWDQFLDLGDRYPCQTPECPWDPEWEERPGYTLKFYPYGLMTYDEFLTFEGPVSYQPHSNDVSHVRYMLGQKGLPTELVDIVLSMADFVPRRSLPIEGKPFHPGNKDELGRYLEECWQLIVRCCMLCRELEDIMHFKKRIRCLWKFCIEEIFDCDCRGNDELFYFSNGHL